MTLVTEKEAVEKWCPMARVYDPQGSFNRTAAALNHDRARCMGSRCMAFRWFDGLSDDGTACVLKPTSHAKRSPLPQSSPLGDRRGFCGASGKVHP